MTTTRQLAQACSRGLWADFRAFGYGAKVSVNVEWLENQLWSQGRKCYSCDEVLELSTITAIKPWNPAACKLVCKPCKEKHYVNGI